MVEKFIVYLRGKKTYIVGATGVLVVFLNVSGYLGAEETRQILTVLGFTGLVTLRMGVHK